MRIILVEFPCQVKEILNSKISFKKDVIISLDPESSYTLKINKIPYHETYQFCMDTKKKLIEVRVCVGFVWKFLSFVTRSWIRRTEVLHTHTTSAHTHLSQLICFTFAFMNETFILLSISITNLEIIESPHHKLLISRFNLSHWVRAWACVCSVCSV